MVLSALDELLTFVLSEIKTLLSKSLAPFLSSLNVYAAALNGAVDPTTGQLVIAALGGTIFQIGFWVAVTIELVITIIFALCMPGASVSDLLVGLIVGGFLTFDSAWMSDLNTLGTGTVSTCESWTGDYADQTSVAGDWCSWMDALSYWKDGPSTEFAANTLTVCWTSSGLSLPGAIGFAVAGLCMDYDAAPSMGGGKIASVSATVCSGISLLLSL